MERAARPRRLLALYVFAALVCGLLGCANTPEGSPASAPEASAPEASAPEASAPEASPPEAGRVELTTWQYRWGDSPRSADGRLVWLDDQAEGAWKPMPYPGQPPANDGPGDRMWMRTEIPPGPWRNPTLMLDPVFTLYEAYLDGERIDHVGNVDATKDEWHGFQWRLVSLPPSDEPRQLVLRFRSVIWLIGIRGRAFVGERAAHQRAIIESDITRFTSGVLSVLVGLVLIVLAAALPVDRRSRATLGAYALGAGGYAIYYTKLKELLFDAPLIWNDIYSFSVLFAAVGITMFVAHIFGNGPWGLLRKLYLTNVAIAVPFYVLVFTVGVRSSVSVLPTSFQNGVHVLFRLLILVAVIVILHVVTQRAREGRRDARAFLLGVVPLALFTLNDLLASAGIVDFAWNSATFVGTLTFLGALIYIVQRRHDDEVRRYAAEKERMLKDLHDGIGGITSNIGLLAEVAARAPSEERSQRIMKDIAELSREGMAEMRSLLDSLDERELTWDRLARQLRHLGGQALGPHEIASALEVEVAKDAGVLTSLVYVHLVRIYREALANVVKHAEASAVKTQLEVTSDEVRLQVEDDGQGLEGDATSGRGLSNMKHRAVELGGACVIENGATAGVVVSVAAPL